MRAAIDELQRAEARCEPAVFRGLAAGAPALRRWGGREGLAHLARVAGGAPVQAMLSSGPEFYGNMDSHEPTDCTFGDLIGMALRHTGGGATPAGAQAAAASSRGGGGGGPFLYLAQQPLASPGLEALLPDVPLPPVLAGKELSAVNLWMSPRESRSSLHYDPYQNLLTVLTGSKTVTLLSPEATPGLYPKSPLGESPNHGSVDIGAPDARRHPLYPLARQQALRVTLRPGDALFIPEGWWHQVDSAAATLAVNYWWSSQLSAALQAVPHLHHYYLRLLQASVVAQATQQLLEGLAAGAETGLACIPDAGSSLGARPATEDARDGADKQSAAKRARTGSPAVGDGPGGGGGAGGEGLEAWAVSSLRHLMAAGEGGARPPRPPPVTLAAPAAEAKQAEAQAVGEAQQQPVPQPQPPQPQPQQQQQQQQEQQEQGQQQQEQEQGQKQQQDKQEGQAEAGSGVRCERPCDPPAGWRCAAAESQQRLVLAAVSGARPGGEGPGVSAPGGHMSEGNGASAASDPLGLSDPVTRVFAALPPIALANALHALATEAPAAMRELLTRRLPPAGAQLLTDKFEAAEQEAGGAGAASSSHEAGPAAAAAAAAAAGQPGNPCAAEARSGGMRGARELKPRLACGSMRDVYAAMYSPAVGADGGEVLRRLLRGKLSLAAAVARAVLPDPAAGGEEL